jgi:hypothetical protein
MVLKVSVGIVVPVILHPCLVLFMLVVRFLVTVTPILLVDFLIATAFVSSALSILIARLAKLATLVVTIILLSWWLSDALVGTWLDVKRIVVRVWQI